MAFFKANYQAAVIIVAGAKKGTGSFLIITGELVMMTGLFVPFPYNLFVRHDWA